MPDCLEALRGHYSAYLDTVLSLEKKRKPLEGIFSFRGGSSSDPCHERFAEGLKEILSDFTASRPESGEAAEVLSYVYTAPEGNQNLPGAYWMLIAVHGLTPDLIGCLDSQDAATLRDSYSRTYPRRVRLPVQQQVFKALEKQANISEKAR